MKLLVMQSSPFSCYLIPIGPTYSPQHSILENPQPTFLPQCERPRFTPTQKNRQDCSSAYLNLHISGQHATYTNMKLVQCVAKMLTLLMSQLVGTAPRVGLAACCLSPRKFGLPVGFVVDNVTIALALLEALLFSSIVTTSVLVTYSLPHHKCCILMTWAK